MSPYMLPLLGRLAWIDVILLCWFVLVLISVSYVAWDAFNNLPEPGVIKWAWVLTTLYLGPFGAAFYILADKEPRPGSTSASSRRCGNKPWARPCTASPVTPPG